MKKIRLVVILCITLSIIGCNASASSWTSVGIGMKVGFVGGPLVYFVGYVEFFDRLGIDISLGSGGPLFRAEANARCSFFSKKLSPYLQAGLGYVWISKSNIPYQEVKEIHLNVGLEYTASLTFWGDAGLLWAPPLINPQVAKEHPHKLPIVPMVSVGVMAKNPSI